MKWTVEYRDFKPSLEFVRELKHQLDNLIEASPYSSYTKLILTQAGDEFHGLLQINSIHQKFVSVASSTVVSDVSARLMDGIHQQLLDWKVCRAV